MLQGNVYAKLGTDEVEAKEAEFDLTNSTGWLKDKIAMGGCDERPFGQDKAGLIDLMCGRTLADMKGVPFLMAPECSVSPKVLDSELRAFRDSVEKY